MAIVETVLGPNTSVFTTSGTTETPATMMNAISAFIVSKGWTLIDNAAPQGLNAGHVFRTPQSGSTTVYKTVGISLSNASFQLIPYESWNSTTHVGTNPYNYYNTGSIIIAATAVAIPSNTTFATDGTSIIVFANPRWLAIRARSNVNLYSIFVGSFEIAKDFGEAATTQAGIFMTSNTPAGYPSSSSTNGYFGTPVSVGTPTVVLATNATGYNNIVTPFGSPGGNFSLNNILSGNIQNFALTMTAAETPRENSSIYGPKILRGRIMGVKIVGGQTNWNDMDTAQVAVDSDFHQSATGTPITHIFINSFQRWLIPA